MVSHLSKLVGAVFIGIAAAGITVQLGMAKGDAISVGILIAMGLCLLIPSK